MKRIVVTGLGAVTPISDSVDRYWKELKNEAACSEDTYYKIKDLNEDELSKHHNIRRNDDFTNLGLAAMVQAFANAQLNQWDYKEERVGAIVNSFYGPLGTVNNYLSEVIQKGLEFASPANFSNTVMNAALGKLSIDFKLKGFSSMLAGTNPISYGFNILKKGKADILFIGAIEKIEDELINTYEESGILNNSASLADGACFLVLEDLNNALRRNCKIYAEICGTGNLTDYDYEANKNNVSAEILERTIQLALKNSECSQKDIRYMEGLADKDALEKIFGTYSLPAIKARKNIFGENYSVTELYNILNAINEFKETAASSDYALCNSINKYGSITSVVVKNYIGNGL